MAIDWKRYAKAAALAANPVAGGNYLAGKAIDNQVKNNSSRSSTYGGAASGAAIGSQFGVPGAIAGGVIGGGIGYFAGQKQRQADEARQAGLDAAGEQLGQVQQQQYAQRMFDLQRGMSFFDPYKQVMSKVYGVDFPDNPQFGGPPVQQFAPQDVFTNRNRAGAGMFQNAPGTQTAIEKIGQAADLQRRGQAGMYRQAQRRGFQTGGPPRYPY